MAKFVFKLQTLLNVKKQMEENMKNELGKAIRSLEDEKRTYCEIEGEREEVIRQVGSESSKGIKVEKIKEYTAYISHLKIKLERQQENINVAADIVDKYREQLIQVMQEREMLDKLREKRFEEFTRELIKDEQKVSDEITNYKYMKHTEEENG